MNNRRVMEEEKSKTNDVEGLGEPSPDEVRARAAKENYFAGGAQAKHKQGVLYQGEFETPSDGTARAVRLHARALAATGIPLQLRSFSNIVVSKEGVAEPVYAVGMPEEVEKEVGHLLNPDIAEMRPVIKHVVIQDAEHCRKILMPKGAIPIEHDNVEQQINMRNAIYGNTIVYSVWERDRIDPGIVKHLARVKQCWVPCLQNSNMLIDSGVPAERVHVVPHPYTPNDLPLRLTKRPVSMHNGWRKFYSIGRWEPRKGFERLIRAFLEAFVPTDKVALTIKYSGSGQWPHYIKVHEVLAWAAQEAPHWTLQQIQERISLVGGRVDSSVILGLHASNNIYVSASHGEAWGLPAFDAKLAGNRLVYVPYGGVADFAEDEDIAIPYKSMPVHDSYRWEHGAMWAGYEVAHLAEGLRRATPPDTFRTPPSYEGRFSMRAVGQKMRDLVDAALVV